MQKSIILLVWILITSKHFFATQGVDSSHITLTNLDILVLRLSFNQVILQESIQIYMWGLPYILN